jgi:hypothetical protein
LTNVYPNNNKNNNKKKKNNKVKSKPLELRSRVKIESGVQPVKQFQNGWPTAGYKAGNF